MTKERLDIKVEIYKYQNLKVEVRFRENCKGQNWIYEDKMYKKKFVKKKNTPSVPIYLSILPYPFCLFIDQINQILIEIYM